MPLSITIQTKYDGFGIDFHATVPDTEAIREFVDRLKSDGFEPRSFQRQQTEVKEFFGTVVSVTLSEKTTRNGKPMYDVKVVDWENESNTATVVKFNKNEYRKGDIVRVFKNDAGYPDVELHDGQLQLPE